jgi:acyl carrier protein
MSVEDRVRALVAERVPDPAAVTRESDLERDLGAIWLDKLGIVMAVEDAFGVDIADEDVDGLKTVGQIIDYVEKKLVVN